MDRINKAMRQTIGDAIGELRRFHNWSQEELAREISRRARRGTPAPPRQMISEWEHGTHAPAPAYRIALARVAESEKATEELAPLFLAGADSWKVVARVQLLDERRRNAPHRKDAVE